ncbi:MAG: hypothetical protein AB7T06_04115 [Kofleriaceae bacterium]
MRAALLVAFAALTAPAFADGSGSANGKLVERARLEVKPVAGSPIKQLAIDNPLGDVKVEGYDGESILIETRKTAPDEEGLDRLRVSLVPNPDGSVRIATTADRDKESKPLSRGNVRIDLIIRAPHNARVDAAVSSGKLEVTKMDAGGELDSATGPIAVSNVAGDLSTHTISGSTKMSVVFGSVDAQSLSSDLDFDSINGERLIASANSGRIAGRRVRARDIELTTTTGRIVLEAEVSLRGRIVVSSLKGDLDVKLRRNNTPLVVRAQGTRVNLGSAHASARTSTDGWVEAQLGEAAKNEVPAFVMLRSRSTIVQFTVVD